MPRQGAMARMANKKVFIKWLIRRYVLLKVGINYCPKDDLEQEARRQVVFFLKVRKKYQHYLRGLLRFALPSACSG